MWHSLTKNYSVPRNPLMNLENFCASRGEPDTGLGMTQSDEPLHNETRGNFRESRVVLSTTSEPSSDTGEVSQSEDTVVNENHESSTVSQNVLSSEPCTDTG
ncbi:Hypothetical predicted protein, partial [Paramuricea clavata]